MPKNAELDLAWNFVEKTNRNIFLTGKAGTGKTTFLRKIRTESMKRLVVVAPTGVAAINAKGVTIHSFFQMPFGPILPNDLQNPKSNFQQKFNKTKIDIIRSLDLLIIDEISMVRADLLDGIDQVLRRYKNKTKVFGGVQVLMIGDLQQLSPVINPSEWSLLSPYYDNAYFFSSNCFKQSNAIGIELKHIYRQDDDKFIKILNEIRNDNLSIESGEILNERFDPNFTPKKEDEYIILTTHNDRANSMNVQEFGKLNVKSTSYFAEIEGKFPEKSYPGPVKLELKVGAQVMFTKNDSEPEKRYFNGKIGEVKELNRSEVIVKCNDNSEITVRKETWENLSYKINSKTQEIDENVAGSFSQIPLKLAWAITIHKSQGLTFEKAIIDAGSSFAHGQTYVALSRCKTLEGIVLKTKISDNSIINDDRVASFTQNVEDNTPDETDLTSSEKAYQLNLVEDLLSYQLFTYPTHRLREIFFKNQTSIEGNLLEKADLIYNALEQLLPISNKFNRQLIKLSETITNPEKDQNIQERIKKGVEYFLGFTKENIEKPLKELMFSTENQAVKKDIQSQMKILKQQLSIKLFCLNGVNGNFSTRNYLDLRTKALFQKISEVKPEQEPYEKKTEHKALFDNLKAYRGYQASSLDIDHFQIFTQRSLYEICNSLPTTAKQLSKVNGMGKVRIEKYGNEILKLVTEYCDTNKIEPKEDSPEVLKPAKGSSPLESLKIFKRTKNVIETAKTRGLATSTIESHLSQFIGSELTPEELIGEEKYLTLKKIMENTTFEGLSDLKNKIDPSYTYWELRVVSKAIEIDKS